MPTSVLPVLLPNLVAMSRAALPNGTVYPGYGASDEPGDFLMVGVDDPNKTDFASSATADQQMATMGTRRSRDEVGDITCVALSWNGDGDVIAAWAAVFAQVAAIENALRADPKVGNTPGLLWAEYGTRLALSTNNDDDGAQAWLVFTVHFKARI